VHGRSGMASPLTVFVGSAAEGTPYLIDPSRGQGIVASFALDAETGDLTATDQTSKVGSNPTAIIAHPGGLIVSEETYGDDTNSYLWSVTVDGTAITAQMRADAGGRAACHLSLHPTGSLVCVANYLGEAPKFDPANEGSFSIYRVSPEDHLGERTSHLTHSTTTYPGANAARQEAAHIHSSAWVRSWPPDPS
jgi:6-phosphogluconolactonase